MSARGNTSVRILLGLDPGMEIGPDRLVMWCAAHGEAFGIDGGCRGCLAEIEELVPIEPSPHPGGSESE